MNANTPKTKREGTAAIRVAVLSAIGFAAVSVHAAQPPDVVQSDGSGNTAMGSLALAALPSAGGGSNTAAGSEALTNNASGAANTAFGTSAMVKNTSGSGNTGIGEQALIANQTGGENTAVGHKSLSSNTASENTAIGSFALYSNVVSGNTAVGYNAMYTNEDGGGNSAFGMQAMYENLHGAGDSAFGQFAMSQNSTGNSNSAFGFESLGNNLDGDLNTAVGTSALESNTHGSYNIGLGQSAGSSLTTGDHNIDIANSGVAGESGTIRIGTSGKHTSVYIQGISTAKVTGSPVYITSTGQLGTLASAERYKTAIASMGSVTKKLMQLRPVTFHLKSEPDGVVQYGLIAEEVDKVYPELAIHDAEGKLSGVRYDELAPMLLNEFQKQQQKMTAQNELATAQKVEIRFLKEQVADLNDLKKELQTAILELHRKDERLAQR